jgi:methionyl-tRNA formyltransferase
VILSDVAFLGAPGARSRLYLQQMMRHGLLPAAALLLPPRDGAPGSGVPEAVRRHAAGLGFDLEANIRDLAEWAGIPCRVLSFPDPNHPDVVDAVGGLSQGVVIYSGPGGAILRKPLLGTGKRFLHVHPGHVPDFRGSTTVYYSLLAENRLAASAFYIEARIDTGPVLLRKYYDPPEDRTTLDHFHDPYVRSELLLDVLRVYAEGRELEPETQDPGAGETYYIIHPVLKHLAILADR